MGNPIISDEGTDMARAERQAAALAVRDGLVCLVSSRNRSRWVIPKGRIEKGQTPGEAALAEAWEEAGLEGRIDGEPLGTYEYTKNRLDHRVTVFPMAVTGESDQWPEAGERTREWLTPAEAIGRIDEPDLRRIVRAYCEARVLVEA